MAAPNVLNWEVLINKMKNISFYHVNRSLEILRWTFLSSVFSKGFEGNVLQSENLLNVFENRFVGTAL
jgi:hypothetical protein